MRVWVGILLAVSATANVGCTGCDHGASWPANPSKVASAIDPTISTDFYDAVKFLFSGSNPIQRGVTDGTITRDRVAVLRGVTRDRDGKILSGVNLTVLGHPELGTTQSRSDGAFDLAVNSGEPLVIHYQADGFCLLQRRVDPQPRRYAPMPDVVLLPHDTHVTAVMSGMGGIQVARGSMINDSDGARQATVIFPAGVTAEMVMGSGTSVPLSTLHVRATEFTVGANGPQAMPGELPPSSGYTYALELSVDEADQAGANMVRFDRPVPFYLENFLKFPVGSPVPAGYYDRGQGAWVPAPDGRVIQIIDTAGGMATIDSDGDGQPDPAATLTALGVDDSERTRLASLYSPGQTLWRVPMAHFTSWDCNWPFKLALDFLLAFLNAAFGNLIDQSCLHVGSIIACENQALGEVIPVAGTPFTLHYQSDRVPGRKSQYQIDIGVSNGDPLPASLKRITVEIDVAGRHESHDLPAQPNQTYTYVWDGKDAYGRTLQGRQPVRVRVGYVYQGQYGQPAAGGNSFATSSDVSVVADFMRQEITIWREQHGSIGLWNAGIAGLGGWSLSAHHSYDVGGDTLERGDGLRVSAAQFGSVITPFAGTDTEGDSGDGGPAFKAQIGSFARLGTGPDGSLYVASATHIRRIGPDGIIQTIAGANPPEGVTDDGVPALDADLQTLSNVVVGRDGSLYFAESDRNLVRRIAPDGTMRTVAGTGTSGFSGDNGPALQATLNHPIALALGPDDTLYIADRDNGRVRRIGMDGNIRTIAGGGAFVLNDDGMLATSFGLYGPQGVAVGPDGSVYVSDVSLVRRVTPDGISHFYAGKINVINGNGISSGDGGPALQAVVNPSSLVVTRDGGLFFVDFIGYRVRYVDPVTQIITAVAGNGIDATSGDGGPGALASLDLPKDIAVDAQGVVYISDATSKIRRLGPPLPKLPDGSFIVPSTDGAEAYLFDVNGRHQQTLNTHTALSLYTFSYDGGGRLVDLADADGNHTKILRDGQGQATAIVGPYGDRTQLAHDAHGYLNGVTYPDGATLHMIYDDGGLLTTFTDALDQSNQITYDSAGRLLEEANPIGGTQTLAHTEDATTHTTTLTTAQNRVTSYSVALQASGTQVRSAVNAAGLAVTTERRPDGVTVAHLPDGTTVETTIGPDPRFYMSAPLVAKRVVTTPVNAHTLTTTASRTVDLSDPQNQLAVMNDDLVTTVNGRATTLHYDGAQQTSTVTSPAGRVRTFTQDMQGRLVRVSVPGLDDSTFSYDARGRLSQYGIGARLSTLDYDAQGQVVKLTDPLGHPTSYKHDAMGRLTLLTSATGAPVSTSYDLNGQISTILPAGHAAGYGVQRDGDGNATSLSLPTVTGGGMPLGFVYDSDGERINVTRADGSKLTIGYDAGGRLSTIDHPGGQLQQHYAAGGQVSGLSDNGVNLAFSYDGQLVTDVITSGGFASSAHYDYDDDLRPVGQNVDGSSPVTFSYDPDGLLSSAGLLTINSDATNGLLTSATLGNVTQTWSYDGAGNPATHAAGSIWSITWVRDAIGRATRRTELIGGVTHVLDFTYDDDGRLTQVQRDSAPASSYVWDKNGNATSRTIGATTETATYDERDRLLTLGARSYIWSADGLLQQRNDASGATTFRYDGFNQLIGVTLPNGHKIDYTLDPWHRRVSKLVDGVPVQGFVYGVGRQVLAETDGSGTLVTRFVYGTQPNLPSYAVKGATTYAFIADSNGSPRLLVDSATGSVTQQIDYDDWGQVISDSQPGLQPFGFDGGLYDRDTGLVRLGARDYDPSTGRFIEVDPSGFNGQQGNLYLYAFGDPVNGSDPQGLGAVKDAAYGCLNGATGGFISGGSESGVNPCSAAYILGTIGCALGADLLDEGLSTELAEMHSPCRSVGEETPVLTDDGDQPIGELAAGVRVLAPAALSSSLPSQRAVTVASVQRDVEAAEVALLVDGERLRATPQHPFFSEDRGWVPAGALAIGERLRRADGSAGTVQAAELRPASGAMANITVERAHAFYVGRQHLLVHNSCEYHHILPRQYREEFEEAGLDFHQYTVPLDRDYHQNVVHEWFNEEWGNFFNEYRAINRSPTQEEILDFANDLSWVGGWGELDLVAYPRRN